MGRLPDMKMKERRGANHTCEGNVQTRWKGMALAVPDSARSNLGFSLGPPRLKPNSSGTGFRRAKARRFHRRKGISSPGINNRGWGSLLPLAACIAAMLLNTGCSRAPSFNILGSFFPAWLLCGIVGIALAVRHTIDLPAHGLREGTVAADPGVSVPGSVLHVHDLAAVL